MIDTYKIIEKWRGEGKVKFIKKEYLENGKIRLFFKEGRKPAKAIDFNDPKEADEIRYEFGGKNEDTFAAHPQYLQLYPDFAKDIYEMGHTVIKINLFGQRDDSKDISKIDILSNCGEKTTIKKSKKKLEPFITKKNIYSIRTETFTMQFGSHEEFENFVEFLLNKDEFQGFKWHIAKLVTMNLELKKYLFWKRNKAGDGSKSMELQLHALDGKNYQKCMIFDLVSAADELIYKECKLINLPKRSPTAWICADAFGQGRVDEAGRKRLN